MKRLLSAILITWSFSLTAGLPPTIIKGQSDTTYKGALKLEVPANQAVSTGSSILIDTGNNDLLVDGSMEATGVTAWTCTVGTCTKTTTAGEFSAGKQALKVALSAQAMNVTQSVSTATGSATQYVVGVNYRVPSTAADFQVCTLIAGAEKTCVPSANLILDDTFHTIEIPEVITPGSTVGIKFKTTTAYTANAFFDRAYIKQGIGYQNLKLDNLYTATISSTGVVSGENIDFINGNCSHGATGTYSCGFNTGIFTTAPNCTMTPIVAIGEVAELGTITSTTLPYNTLRTDTRATSDAAVYVACQKTGNDYLASSAAVYSQVEASGVFTRVTGQTPITTANNPIKFPTISNDTTNGAYSASTGQFTVTQTGFYDVSVSSIGVVLAANSIYYISVNGATAPSSTSPVACVAFGTNSGCAGTGTVYATVGQTIDVRANANITGAGNTYDYVIFKKSSANTPIVGSFAGYTNVPGYQGRVDNFNADFGAAATTVCSTGTCAYLDQVGTGVQKVDYNGTAGDYIITFNKTYSSLKCNVKGYYGTTDHAWIGKWDGAQTSPLSCASCNTMRIRAMAYNETGTVNIFGTIYCQGTY